MAIPNEIKLRCFDDVLAVALGGQRVIEMLVMFHCENRTYQEISEIHGLTDRSHAKKIIDEANKAIQDMGLWNPMWQEKYRRARSGAKPEVTLEKIHA